MHVINMFTIICHYYPNYQFVKIWSKQHVYFVHIYICMYYSDSESLTPHGNKFLHYFQNLFSIADKADPIGTGNFSVVFLGLIKSRQLPVAVKCSLTTTDAVQFKALLLEIKIMLHIGKHENVVALVRVCTECIQQRKNLKKCWNNENNVVKNINKRRHGEVMVTICPESSAIEIEIGIPKLHLG